MDHPEGHVSPLRLICFQCTKKEIALMRMFCILSCLLYKLYAHELIKLIHGLNTAQRPDISHPYLKGTLCNTECFHNLAYLNQFIVIV